MRKPKFFVFSALVALTSAVLGLSLRAFTAGAAAEPKEPSAAAASGNVGQNAPPAQAPKTEEPERPSPAPAGQTAAEDAAPAADGGSSSSAESDEVSGGGEMILVTNPRYNRDNPLLFDSGHESDNSSCMVCHVDFEEELIARVHLEAGITCMACHGDSLSHRSDEFNITRPDVIWGRAEIEPFCRQCHLQHKHPDKVEVYRKEHLSQRRENGRYVSVDSPCTDCHGKHAITLGEGNFK